MRFFLTALALAILGAGPSAAAPITYIFNTGDNILSPSWPALGGLSPSGTAGVSLGTTILSLADAGGLIQGATLTGSGTLFCVTASNPAQCAANANSDTAGTGHASGLGVGDGRLQTGETLIISIAPGYTATLISFQVTAMVADELGFYNLGSGDTSFSGGSNPIDTITVNSGAFTTLTFGTPAGSGAGGAYTWALHSLTLDITANPTIPEPSTWALTAFGLAGLAMWKRKRA